MNQPKWVQMWLRCGKTNLKCWKLWPKCDPNVAKIVPNYGKTRPKCDKCVKNVHTCANVLQCAKMCSNEPKYTNTMPN